jgi:hypothetical protein
MCLEFFLDLTNMMTQPLGSTVITCGSTLLHSQSENGTRVFVQSVLQDLHAF